MKITFDDGREFVLSQELSEKLEKEINEATKEEKKKTEFYEVGRDKNYCYIGYDGSVDWDNEYYAEAVDNLNAFTTEEFAEKIAFKQLMERKLLKFSLEHDGDKIDWNDNETKYKISMDINRGIIIVDTNNEWKTQGTYFYSKEIAQAAIDEFHDDLIKYFQLDFSK